MTSPILWQSSDESVILIDIPRSISAAQGSDDAQSSRHLLSSPPLQSLLPSNEPKSALARAKLKIDAANHELHSQYEVLLQWAIDQVKVKHDGDWCLARRFVEQPSLVAKKRKHQDSEASSLATDQVALPDGCLSHIARANMHTSSALHVSSQLHKENRDKTDSGSYLVEHTEGLSACNNDRQTCILRITPDGHADTFSFYVPRNASFYLGDCRLSKSFRDAVRKHAQQTGTRNGFDFILLDPPWPNRSVKRTHKTPGTTYATSPSLEDMRDLILNTHLEILMEVQCLVGIWITNKPSIRDLIVGENGIFNCWDIDLVEEWLWLKTTVHGESVTPLDGIWRKPYEVLLLGRRRPKDKHLSEEEAPPQDIKRRVIIGVPDLHSRKPCLKTLIEPMMDRPTDYRALEAFARHLVAGWWSWGDECIKFNWDGYWRKDAEDEKT